METNQTKKSERSEYISFWVTSEFKKEFDIAKDNPTIVESIVKRYLTSEVDFLQTEISNIDEATIKYKARLIGIKDNFEKAQDIYVAEIEKLYEVVHAADTKINKGLQESADKVASLTKSFDFIKKDIEKLDCFKIDSVNQSLVRFMDTINKFNTLPENEKELIKSLLIKQP